MEILIFNFSPAVRAVLGKSGWQEDRSVTTAQWTEPFSKMGIESSTAAIQILENLGGLTITPDPHPSNLFFPGQIFFDPAYAASSEVNRIKKWQQDHDLLLFPLGEYDPIFILLCSADGRIFGAREGTFHFLGNTIEEALEVRVLAHRKPTHYRAPKHE